MILLLIFLPSDKIWCQPAIWDSPFPYFEISCNIVLSSYHAHLSSGTVFTDKHALTCTSKIQPMCYSVVIFASVLDNFWAIMYFVLSSQNTYLIKFRVQNKCHRIIIKHTCSYTISVAQQINCSDLLPGMFHGLQTPNMAAEERNVPSETDSQSKRTIFDTFT